jgi:hypothetical protein
VIVTGNRGPPNREQLLAGRVAALPVSGVVPSLPPLVPRRLDQADPRSPPHAWVCAVVPSVPGTVQLDTPMFSTCVKGSPEHLPFVSRPTGGILLFSVGLGTLGTLIVPYLQRGAGQRDDPFHLARHALPDLQLQPGTNPWPEDCALSLNDQINLLAGLIWPFCALAPIVLGPRARPRKVRCRPRTTSRCSYHIDRRRSIPKNYGLLWYLGGRWCTSPKYRI